jgi:hypothetical protein
MDTTSADEIAFLDDIICKHYREILKKIENEEELKLGDWLKMIELKRKLAPSDTVQKKFWEKLEQIRQEELGAPKNKKTVIKKNRKKRKNEKKSA